MSSSKPHLIEPEAAEDVQAWVRSLSTDHPLPMPASVRHDLAQGLRSIEENGGIPIEEVEAWVDSWDSPDELPMPRPHK